MIQAACFYAEQNGFFPGAGGNLAGCIPANDPNGTVLTVNYPPTAAAGNLVGTDGYVQVGLSRVHRSFLAGIVGLGNLRVSSMAVAAFTVGQSNSSSLIALDPGNTCTSGRTHGNGKHHDPPGRAGDVRGVRPRQLDLRQRNAEHDMWFDRRRRMAPSSSTATARSPRPPSIVTGTCKASGTLVGPLTEGAVQIGDPLAELPPPPVGSPESGRRMRRRHRGFHEADVAPDPMGAASTEVDGQHAAGRVLRRLEDQRSSDPGPRPGHLHHGGRRDPEQRRHDHVRAGRDGRPGAGADLQHRQPGDPYWSGVRRPPG